MATMNLPINTHILMALKASGPSQRRALCALEGWQNTVNQAAASFKVPPADLLPRLTQMQQTSRDLEKEISALKGQLAAYQGEALAGQAVDVKGVKLIAAQLDGADAATLRQTATKLKDKLHNTVMVLAAVDGDKVALVAAVSKDAMGKIKAGELVSFVAAQVGGKGGGKPDMAMAGGTQPAALPAALASVAAWVAERA